MRLKVMTVEQLIQILRNPPSELKDRETIVEGLEKAPEAINMLFTGGNIGKTIVKV